MKIGTRGSPLALAQSRHIAAALALAHPGLCIAERIIRTSGDNRQEQPLPSIGGKGLFTLEIENALLAGEIDFAVHSLKDLPPLMPAGLCLAAVPQRASAADVCVVCNSNPPPLVGWAPEEEHFDALTWAGGEGPRPGEGDGPMLADVHLLDGVNPRKPGAGRPLGVDARHWAVGEHRATPLLAGTLPFLPHGARVGTSSLRRQAQLLHLRPDLHILDVRGNIDTRLKKLEAGGYDAIILAAAGLHRLGLPPGENWHLLNERDFIPAPGQGALAIQARSGDEETLQLLAPLNHAATCCEVKAERAAMIALGAGCATPLGARAVVNAEKLSLWSVVLSPDGRQRIFAEKEGNTTDAEKIGHLVAADLLSAGAAELLAP